MITITINHNTLINNKTQGLASNYGTNQPLVVYEKCVARNRPSTQLIDVTSFV